MPLVSKRNLSIAARDVLPVGGPLLSFASRVQGPLRQASREPIAQSRRVWKGRNMADAVSHFQKNIVLDARFA